MIIIAASLTFMVLSFLNSARGFQAANSALALAMSGYEDALLQLARNQNTNGSYCVPDIACGGGTASVSITSDSPQAGFATIVSSAKVLGRERAIQALVTISTSTSEIQPVSWQLITQ